MPKASHLHPQIHKIRYEHTFCMVKPDGVMRGLVGEIIHRLEKAGLKVVALKMVHPTVEQAKAHYPTSDEAWMARLGEKSLMGFADNPEVDVEEVLGTTDKMVIGQEVVNSLI